MANNSEQCLLAIDACLKSGIKINSFSYTVDENMEIWASEKIKDETIATLNNDQVFKDIGVEFLRRNSHCICVTF